MLADDHAILRETLRESLEAETDFSVVGDVGDGTRAVELATTLRPDVVLLDIDMKGIPAAVTVRRLHEMSPATRVVILSMYDCADFVRDMLALGVRGYLSKGVSRQHLVSAIRAAMDDNQAVLVSVTSDAGLALLPVPQGSDPLSARECELLTLVAQAMTNRQIASRLAITEATVKRHLYNIFTKLGSVSRIDAVNKAVGAGLVSRTG